MRAATYISLLSIAGSAALAQSLCAVNCFSTVVTDYPPLDCTLSDMYHCFCSMPSLQTYFVDCVYAAGAYNDSEGCDASGAADAVAFGTSLCSELGYDISITTPTPDEPTTSSAVTEPDETATTTAEPATTDIDEEEPEITASTPEPEETDSNIVTENNTTSVEEPTITNGTSVSPKPTETFDAIEANGSIANINAQGVAVFAAVIGAAAVALLDNI